MKEIITLFAVLCSLIAVGQTSEEHLQNGISKHEQQDFKGAIRDYERAIKTNKENMEAYFNRGTCKLALNDLKGAMQDFNKTIELEPKFAKAYYSRATVLVKQAKYSEALSNLDRTIKLDPTLPNALTLRGQIRAQSGNKEGACDDFRKAKEAGDKNADRYINQFCGNEQQNGESLMLYWPEEENWKVGNSQENDQMMMLELIRSNETLKNWTELGSMMSLKGVRNIPMDQAMNLMFEQAKQNSPNSRLTFIEKDESVEYPWILFMIESPNFKNDKRPESQLWYVVQGKDALYTNFRAVRKATIPEDLKNKWINFFKTAEIKNK